MITLLGASALRSCETWYCRALAAVRGGRAPHNSSIKRSVETTSFARVGSGARGVRCLAPPSGSARPWSMTSSGPRIQNSTFFARRDASTLWRSQPNLSGFSATGLSRPPRRPMLEREREAVSVQPTDGIGVEFLDYRIEALVGHGGMGVVYRAHDVRLKRTVALKLMAPALALDERFQQRFSRESELAMSLEHPNVVPIYDAGEVDGRLYLAMRYVDGTDLRRRLREEGTLAPGDAVAIVKQVAYALDAAHAKGLVHRDVKPSNVLLD